MSQQETSAESEPGIVSALPVEIDQVPVDGVDVDDDERQRMSDFPAIAASLRPYGDAPTRMLHRNIIQPWNEVTDSPCVPSARFGHTAVVHHDRMLLFGGRDTAFHNDVWAYDFARKVWNQLNSGEESRTDAGGSPASSPAPRAGHTAVVSTNSMWVFGGNVGHHARDCKNEVWQYSIDTTSWTRIQHQPKRPADVTAADDTSSSRSRQQLVPQPRKGHTAVKYKEQAMLVFGGQGVISDNKVWQFSFVDQRWSVLSTTGEVPAERLYHVAEMTEMDKMLVFGGRSANPDGQFYDDLYELDPAVGIWRKVHCEGGGPCARMCSSSIYRNGAFCVFLGGSSAYHGDSYEFDTASNTWRPLVCDSPPNACTRPTTVVYNNRLTLFGGCSAASYLNATLEIELEVPSLRELARQWLRHAGISDVQVASIRGLSPCVKQYLAASH